MKGRHFRSDYHKSHVLAGMTTVHFEEVATVQF